MAAGLPDLVDCARLAEEAAVLVRDYDLGQLPRLQDVLAEPVGMVRARFAFGNLASGRAGADVSVVAAPRLVCQRCMQSFEMPVSGGSAVEFAASDDDEESDAEREFFRMRNGEISLCDLAEEELLLALPLAPMCTTPSTCGKAPGYMTAEAPAAADEMRKPFSVLQDLLKKT